MRMGVRCEASCGYLKGGAKDGIDLEDVEARTARRESDVPREPRVRISKLLSAEELVQRRAALNHSRSAAESL